MLTITPVESKLISKLLALAGEVTSFSVQRQLLSLHPDIDYGWALGMVYNGKDGRTKALSTVGPLLSSTIKSAIKELEKREIK